MRGARADPEHEQVLVRRGPAAREPVEHRDGGHAEIGDGEQVVEARACAAATHGAAERPAAISAAGHDPAGRADLLVHGLERKEREREQGAQAEEAAAMPTRCVAEICALVGVRRAVSNMLRRNSPAAFRGALISPSHSLPGCRTAPEHGAGPDRHCPRGGSRRRATSPRARSSPRVRRLAHGSCRRQPGVPAGLDVAEAVFVRVDRQLRFAVEGSAAGWRGPGTLATVEGDAASILAGERVALNFLGRLSGVATLTARYVRGRRGHRRADPRHAQDDAGHARPREGGGPRRRRDEPPQRPLRRDPRQGEPRALAGGVGEAARLALARGTGR